jgi:hypothetical protein
MATISVTLESGNALRQPADVFILKYAQASHGLDRFVIDAIRDSGKNLNLPAPWDFCVADSPPAVTASSLLFIGVPPLREFRYPEIRTFARKALAILREKMPRVKRALFTVHGINYGLDESEAFGAEVAGFMDAVQAGEMPESLREVLIVEHDRGRAGRLSKYLENLLPGGRITCAERAESPDDTKARETLQSIGHASDTKPHVFVAMPIKDEMDDVYHYGIYSAVKAADFVCERADLSAFTGDILDWVKSRIRSASLVVADLTEANPNVYLEVGYAWGVGIPTVLVAQSEEHLKIDVRGQRCLIYKKIKELEDKLTSQLSELKRRA